MNIRTEIREIQAYIEGLTSNKDEQIAIISEAQSVAAETNQDQQYQDVLALVKRRIING